MRYHPAMSPDDVNTIAEFVGVHYQKVAAIVALAELRLAEQWQADEKNARVPPPPRAGPDPLVPERAERKRKR